MSRAAPQHAFVLHQWAWSETSLIIDLFTRGQGRLAVVAKGAKRPYSQLRPVLMPFQRLLVLTGVPKAAEAANVLTLRSAEYAGAGAALPPAKLFTGFYLNELLLKLLVAIRMSDCSTLMPTPCWRWPRPRTSHRCAHSS